MKIDIHFHVMPEGYLSALRDKGHIYPDTVRISPSGEEQISTSGEAWIPLEQHFRDTQTIIRDMDDSKRDIAVLSPAPFLCHYELDGKAGEAVARKVNDAISQMIKEHPDRFAGMATVPLQDVPRAVRELERVVGELGIRAVEIWSNVNGKNLDEADFFPFFQRAQSLGILIFVHPSRVAGRERMTRYHLANLIGNPTDTAICLGSLIFGGVLERLPGLKVCLAHAGGTAPYVIGRWDHGYRVRPECRAAITKPPSEYFKLVYFDTITHSQESLIYLVSRVGSEKVLMGSDYPYDMSDPQPVATVGTLEAISQQDKERIWGENAAELIKKVTG